MAYRPHIGRPDVPCQPGHILSPFKLVDVRIVERTPEVLGAASFQELRLHLLVRYLRYGDDSLPVHGAMCHHTVIHHLLLDHVLAVDVSEDGPVLRAVCQRERHGKGVAVRVREQPVL